MRAFHHPRFRAPTVLTGTMLGSFLLLSACSEGALRTFGLTKDSPDEFTVVTHPPLSMPPSFVLVPPRPGAPNPNEQSARDQAQEALAPQTALMGGSSGASAGQAALLTQTGPAAPADIRDRVDSQKTADSDKAGFIDKLLYWRKPNTGDTQVDPAAEAKRLRENSALGQGVEVGDTPIIAPSRQGFFSRLFSWL